MISLHQHSDKVNTRMIGKEFHSGTRQLTRVIDTTWFKTGMTQVVSKCYKLSRQK
jgi:hypothetical protein